MAVVVGNIALAIDVTAPRVALPERKIRSPGALDVLLSLSRREPHLQLATANSSAAFAGGGAWKGFDSDGEPRRNHKAANSKANGGGFDSGFSDEESNGSDGEIEEEVDWERRMRERVKEIEEMRELEKKAEELQSRAEGSDGEEEAREETEEEKKMRIKKELEKVAREQAERRATAELMFELGQKAYEKGAYGRSIEFLEGALTIIPKWTMSGGEIQIWLAMAYEANNRHKDCIALYQQLERKHPSVNIRRQAAELRYILQAPKLKISQEEMVTIPLIGSSYDSYAATWSDKYKDVDQRRSGSTTSQLPSSRDYLGDFLVWRPPVGLEKNQTFWIAVTVWTCLVGAALYLHR